MWHQPLLHQRLLARWRDFPPLENGKLLEQASPEQNWSGSDSTRAQQEMRGGDKAFPGLIFFHYHD
jgi:hypothetical protein